MGDEGADVSFSFDGRDLTGREGEPIAVALWRNDEVALGRSVKYHRPRGPYCFQGACPGCMVEVDGEPNVRACRRPLREGVAVRSQVGVPSARRDVFGIVDRIFPNGFDHQRIMTRPRPLGDVYHWIARRMAGTGRPPSGAGEADEAAPELVRVEPDVLVAGGGAAGLSAAAAAAGSGATVVVADPWPGGQLAGVAHPIADARDGPALATELERRARRAGATVAVGPAVGVYDDGVVPVLTGRRLLEVRPTRIVIATGATEAPLLVPNADLPGVIGSRALARLVVRHGWEPEGPVVVAGGHDAGLETALVLAERGARVAVAGAADARPELRERIAASGAAVLTERVASVSGELRAEAVILEGGRKLPCQVLAANAGLVPSPELVQQAAVERRWVDALGGFVPIADGVGATSDPNVFVAGSAAGVHDVAAALVQGRLAGLAAAGRRSDAADGLAELEDRIQRLGRRVGEALDAVWTTAGGQVA